MIVTSICTYVFWISLGLLLYTYIGYGLFAGFLGLFRGAKKQASSFKTTPVTIIIPAYNESGILPRKITNTLNALKNFDHAQVIIITDGSTDGSGQLQFSDQRVLHLHESDRLGKSAAINKAMQQATGEIVIMTDANAMINEYGFENLVLGFANEKIGAVSGEKKVQQSDGSVGGEGIYWTYESFLKKQSARMYSLTGAAGELIAIRRSVFKPIPPDAILDDLQLSLDIIRQNKIIAYEPGAFVVEPPSQSFSDEFRRKVRISAGVFQTLRRNLFVFNPFKYPLFNFQFFSHRILRWFVTIDCLILLYISNFLICWFDLTDPFMSIFFRIAFILQNLFYLMVLLGFLMRNTKLPSFLFLPFYFIMMNVSVWAGFLRYIRKKESVMWHKATR